MLSFGATKLLVRYQLARAVRRNMSSDEIPEAYRSLVQPNMNVGYPVPNQLYSEAYANQQKKNNKFLGTSIFLLFSSIMFVYINDTFGFLAPPPREVNIPLDQLRY